MDGLLVPFVVYIVIFPSIAIASIAMLALSIHMYRRRNTPMYYQPPTPPSAAQILPPQQITVVQGSVCECGGQFQTVAIDPVSRQPSMLRCATCGRGLMTVVEPRLEV